MSNKSAQRLFSCQWDGAIVIQPFVLPAETQIQILTLRTSDVLYLLHWTYWNNHRRQQNQLMWFRFSVPSMLCSRLFLLPLVLLWPLVFVSMLTPLSWPLLALLHPFSSELALPAASAFRLRLGLAFLSVSGSFNVDWFNLMANTKSAESAQYQDQFLVYQPCWVLFKNLDHGHVERQRIWLVRCDWISGQWNTMTSWDYMIKWIKEPTNLTKVGRSFKSNKACSHDVCSTWS